MKALVSTLLAVLVINCTYAKIWRVNNNAGIAADFTTLAAAQEGASAGDTLHIEPSATNYGSITLTKRLVIIGTGYYLNENPNTQAIKQSSLVNSITLYSGASGSVIMGLDFTSNDCNVYANDVVIRRNKFATATNNSSDYYTGAVNLYYNYQGDNTPARNVIISQNYGCRVSVNYPSTGVLISNNYISYYSYAGDATTGDVLRVHTDAIVIIQNNIIRRGKVSVYNSNITNNIMVNGTFEGTGNLVSHNLANATQFGTTDGNKANIDMGTVFLGTGTGVSSDGQWKLAAGSPAIGAGYGSTPQKPVDTGIYSGQTPYVLSGMPPVPAIYFFENKPIGSNTDPISVTIKVKSNN
ncbi:hypothetical protein [Foetidibacter luteolus]|uniref:hypothetical protein n=1 Tax=Foetidibacter luteolus TaxID=2608880 RepID=UPI00129B546D|nr:hypothetical protein [Foetidibacter luteolus]